MEPIIYIYIYIYIVIKYVATATIPRETVRVENTTNFVGLQRFR